MIRRHRPPLFALWLTAGLAAGLPGETAAEELLCGRAAAWRAPADSAEHRKYAPDRLVDILHMTLEITPDFKQRTITGTATLAFKPLVKPLEELALDAVDLTIEKVTATEPVQGWQNDGKTLTVTFVPPVAAGRETKLTIQYHAQPANGLYFRTPEMGYKDGDTHLFTQGEAILARHWCPCFDAPHEKFTSEITCWVPEGMTAVANGKLMSQAKDPQSGLVGFRWLQDRPHSNYLIALVAGYFKKLEATHRDVPLTFYTPPSEIDAAATSFADTAAIMAFFEQEIGEPYPWAKYAQVCVNDFVAGGMENTSLTVLTDHTLFTPATENLRSSEGLVAHEMAHQWFGDLVTCKDWSHLWLNEGFATYYAHLYEGHHHGRDQLLYGLYGSARGFLDTPNDTQPIVYREYDSPDEQFSFLAYPKGGWVLHMLRTDLGEELYRRCIKTYLERHRFGSVTTEDLRAVIEELSGRPFDQFFDQWVYHAHHPELDVNYSWDELAKLAKVSIRQTQALSDRVLLFKFPLTIRFLTQAGPVDRRVTVQQKDEAFYFALPQAPQRVRLDPELGVLAKVKFAIPDAMLLGQIRDTNDAVGRVLAVAQLAGRSDHDAVSRLKERLNEDPFYGVRLEASRTLRGIHTDEALEALLASTNQPDARVRRQVREDLGGFYRPAVLAAAQQTLVLEKNPDIQVQAIATLGPYASAETRQTLLQYLNSDSFRNEVAVAAINAMGAQDDPGFIAPLLETLQKREAVFTTGGFSRGLGVLARLARNEENREAVREFLTRQTSHLKRSVRNAALAALGDLGDPKAIAVVSTFTRAGKDTPERQTADKALATLRAAKKPTDDLRDLRNEVLELQKENRELRKDLDDLKKRLKEQAPAAANPPAAKAKSPPPPPKKRR